MSDPIKTTDQVRSDQEAFKAAYERASEVFRRIEGVVGVGYGLKQTGGEFGDDIAIVVFVQEKKPRAALADNQIIPPTFEGYRTDVRIVPATRRLACDNSAKYATIQGGIQITNAGKVISQTPDSQQVRLAKGTIACIVRKRQDLGRENVYILSNHHVLQALEHGAGDYIYHPEFGPGSVTLGPVQEGGREGDISFTPSGGTAMDVFVDCAFARLDIDSKCCGSTCTKDTLAFVESIIDLVQVTPVAAAPGAAENLANVIADVRNVIGDVGFIGSIVTKVGRSTGKTQGTVVSVTTTFNNVDPADPTVIRYTGHNAIEIAFDAAATNCLGHAFFAEEGDSGSLVVDDQRRAVGLLSQGALPTDPPGSSSLACHIVPVLDHLNICIPCADAGTSHGSSHAEDGSGLAPSPLPPDAAALPPGQIVFTSRLGGVAAGNRPVFTPEPLTGDEIAHMHQLLAEFRATRLGPELHATFAEVRREVGYLVRNSRPVTVAWRRSEGPAFLAHVLNHLAGHADRVPHQVKGVWRRDLLTRMREVLGRHGSNPLRAALERYGDELIDILTRDGCDSAADCLSALRERELV